ncbi:MAG: hypothetical protein NWE89_15755 [Candidatus Bathyarchaeota archaeon]|nr:hypothetical protein [Candidatus Bathyarchaeota archaeon]
MAFSSRYVALLFLLASSGAAILVARNPPSEPVSNTVGVFSNVSTVQVAYIVYESQYENKQRLT